MADFNLGNLAEAIKQQESGGNYAAVNPKSGALGAYQVMPFNLPAWGKAAGYDGITPAQFLANPKAQEDIAKMQLSNYAAQYGDPGVVARVWYGGPKAANNPHISGGAGYPTTGEYAKQVLAKGGMTLNSVPDGIVHPPHTLTPSTAGPEYTPAAVAAANPAPAAPPPPTFGEAIRSGDVGGAIKAALTKPTTKDAQGNDVQGKSPLEKLAALGGDTKSEAPAALAPLPIMPAQDPDPGLAPAAQQLFASVQASAAKPLSWNSRPYGYNAGYQGTTLNQTGYGGNYG